MDYKKILIIILGIILLSATLFSATRADRGEVSVVNFDGYQIVTGIDGDRTLLLDGGKSFYKDQNGVFNEVNETFVHDEGLSKIVSGKYSVYLKSDITAEDAVFWSYAGDNVSMWLNGIGFSNGSTDSKIVMSSFTTTMSGNEMSYVGLSDGIDIVYSYEPLKFKESVVIRDVGSLKDAESFSKGDFYVDFLYRANFDLQKFMTRPFINDSKGRVMDIPYSMYNDYSGNHLKYSIAVSTMKNLSYPIVIDPGYDLDANVSTLCGVQNYDYINIVNGATLTVCNMNWSINTGWLWLNATYNITIDSTSKITALGSGFPGAPSAPSTFVTGRNGTFYNSTMSIGGGYPPGFFPSWGYGQGGCHANPNFNENPAQAGGSGASVASNGSGTDWNNSGNGWSDCPVGSGQDNVIAGIAGWTGYGNATNLSVIYLGGGGGSGGGGSGGNGGAGGAGGGGIRLEANYINISGRVIVNGSNGANADSCSGDNPSNINNPTGGSGGGSGKIVIKGNNIILDNSILSASGGRGAPTQFVGANSCGAGSQGGGGSIVIQYSSLSNNTALMTIDGGSGGIIFLDQVQSFAPSVEILTPVNASNLTNASVVFSFNATDDGILGTCELWGNWTGAWSWNYSWIGPNMGLVNLTSLVVPDGSWVWGVWCNDTSGLGNWSAFNYTFNLDATNPSISLVNITNATGAIINTTQKSQHNHNLTFSITVSDSNGVASVLLTIWNTIASAGIKLYESFLSLVDGVWGVSDVYLNLSFPKNAVMNYTVNATDYFGNMQNYVGNFSVGNTAPSRPVLLSPINNTNTTLTYLALQWVNSTDNDSDSMTYLLEVGSMADFSAISYRNASISGTSNNTNDTTSALLDGRYYWRTLANDGTANSSFSQTSTFTVDTKNPDAFITSPNEGQSFTTTASHYDISLNLSIIDSNPSLCWYNITDTTESNMLSDASAYFACADGYTASFEIKNPYLILNPGTNSYQLMLTGTDALGNVNSTYNNFTIEWTKTYIGSFVPSGISGSIGKIFQSPNLTINEPSNETSLTEKTQTFMQGINSKYGIKLYYALATITILTILIITLVKTKVL